MNITKAEHFSRLEFKLLYKFMAWSVNGCFVASPVEIQELIKELSFAN